MVGYRPVSYSQTVITELMIPSYANFGGKVHGGYILSLMDKIAYACSSRHAGAYCVTASVDTVDFKHPVEVGEMIHMYASVNYVGRSSLEIGIRTESHQIRTGETHHTNTSYFTMVAMGDNGKPQRVPGLKLETQEEVRRFLEGMERRRMKREYSRARGSLNTLHDIEQAMETLSKERCQVSWKPAV